MTTFACSTCGFELWRPIASLNNSSLGLYSDSRFPGRSILSLDKHFDHLDEVPPDALYAFMMDVKTSIAAIKSATGADRVNSAILGNQEGHVHAHLIPRHPSEEPKPDKAPWEDTRPKESLDVIEEARLIREIQGALSMFGNPRFPVPRVAARLNRPPRVASPNVGSDLPLFAMISDEPSLQQLD